MLIRVSYPLERSSPLYLGTPPVSVAAHQSFAEGHASSSSNLSFNTHSGTHVDAPLHCCPGGAGVADLLGAGKVFSPLGVLDLPGTGDAGITPDDLGPLLLALGDVSALLLRTGDWRRRSVDPADYGFEHPWIHPGVPDLLRKQLPSLRIFGVDTISIGSPLHRDEGRACHRAFLCGSPPIMILEDLDLSDPRLAGHGFSLHVFPWFREPLDGIPVVAIAEKTGSLP
ncbi:MAG: cyclase family protein [Methanomicrobiales archaeon]|nr:cyclase family protein [Methanomicrobiales archaeon]